MKMSSLSILAMIGFGAMQLAAQSGQLYANIPFDFSVGTQSFVAGKYLVSPMAPDVIAINSADRRAHRIVLTHAVQSNSRSGKASLVFRQYGDSYFLWQVWNGDSIGRELPRSRTERAIMATMRSAPPVAVVASVQ